MRIGLLGPLTLDGRPFEAGRRERQLLVLLASNPGRPVSTERIVEAIWGEAPPTNPGNAIQAGVSRLRRALGDLEVDHVAGGYRLAVDPDAVDVVVVEQLISAARESASPERRLPIVEEAIDLVRGDPAAELAEVHPAETSRLEGLAVAAAELRAETLLALGRATDAVAVLESLVDRHPLRERPWARLVEALYADGRQAEALRAYRRAATVLAEELGVEPGPELVGAEERVLVHDPALSPVERPLAGSLPSLRTRVFGRSSEVRAVEAAATRSPLVTVTGPGGVGKTTLAVRMAESDDRPSWFVDLTAATDAESVRIAVAAVFERRSVPGAPSDRIVSALAGQRAIVIIDNCEHVLDGAAELAAELIERLPELTIVATSRAPLGLSGEQVVRLAPLASTSPTDPAVELFLDRARAVAPDGVSEGDLELVVEICSMVDGLPLAVVLVASATSTMTLEQVHRRLRDGLHLPAVPARDRPERHASVDATIDWSVDQLDGEARTLLGRLSVFEAPPDLDAIVEVCGFAPLTEASVVDALAALVTASLLSLDAGRYRMLATVRANAARRLGDEERVEVERRHVVFHADVALGSWPDLLAGPEQANALAASDRLRPDLEVALRRAIETEPERVADIAAFVVWASTLRVRDDASLRLVESILDQLDVAVDRALVNARLGLALSSAIGARSDASAATAEAATADAERLGLDREVGVGLGIQAMLSNRDLERAVALVERGFERVPDDDRWAQGILSLIEANVVGYTDGVDRAATAAERAVELLGSVGDDWRRATALGVLGTLHLMRGRYADADDVHREMIRVSDRMGLELDGALARNQLANSAMLAGRHAEASDLAERALAHAERTGGGAVRANALNTVGRVANALGAHDRAREAHREAVEIYRLLDGWAGVAHSLDSLGFVESSAGAPTLAEALHLEALEITGEAGDRLSVAFSLEGLALARALDDRGEEAARLLGAADRLRRSLGVPLVGGERRYVSRAEAVARESTSDFERAFAAGADAEHWRDVVADG